MNHSIRTNFKEFSSLQFHDLVNWLIEMEGKQSFKKTFESTNSLVKYEDNNDSNNCEMVINFFEEYFPGHYFFN